MAYRDLRELIDALDERGLLHRVTKEVDKDWELSAFARRVFQRIPTNDRPALLFENVKGYDIPVAVGVLGASPDVYALCLETTRDKVFEAWSHGSSNPIEPVIVNSGPIQENIFRGEEADLYKLPVPIWSVEHDGGPYFTSPYIVTVDPELGDRNVGTYRLQLKGKRKLGLYMNAAQGAYRHIMKNEAEGKDTPIAIIVGADPTIGLVSVAKFPFGVDEFGVAGGLRGEPVELVNGTTVPMLQYPSTSEIVIEGRVLCKVRESEGPFGEYTGYMGAAGDHFVVEVDAILHRDNAIYQAFLSEMPPSESSCIRGLGRELPMLHHLKSVLKLPVKDLHMTEAGGAAAWTVVSVYKGYQGLVQQVINACWGYGPMYSKILVVVDEDIDVRDPFKVQWAMSYRFMPSKDIYVMNNTATVALDPSTAAYSVPEHDPSRWVSSKVAFDCTMSHEYPPLALPPQEHLDLVDSQWELYGLSLEGTKGMIRQTTV